jgi:hypothetical protein
MNCKFNETSGVCEFCGFVCKVPSARRNCLGGCLAGTHLKLILAGWPFRIVATADCKCTSRAGYMDAKGCDWCESEEGMAEIIGFLREAAEERGLPFVDMAARLLVKRAIHNARKAEAKRAKEAEQAAAEGRPA